MELNKNSVYKFIAVNIYIFKRGDLKSLIQTSTKRKQKKRSEPNTNQAQGNKKYYCKLNEREQKNNREKSTKSKAASLKKSENFTYTDQLTRTQITKFRNERLNITSNRTKIKFILVSEYREQPYGNKL